MCRGLRTVAVALVAVGWLGLPTTRSRADLTTYGYTNARDGAMPGRGGIAPAAVSALKIAWRASVDGAINAQPLVVDHVAVAGRPRNLVVVATEHGVLAALDARNGRLVWRRQLGHRTIKPDCQSSPDGVFGLTGTPVADRASGLLYAVDVDGRAWAVTLATGRVISGWPRRVHPSAGGDFVWGALGLSRGWLYVPIASLCDHGQYDGGIVAVDLKHPKRMRVWHTTAGSGAYAGGIWGWGGVSVDDRTGDVFAATGNSLGTLSEAAPRAESVVRLSGQLILRQWNDPLQGPFQATDRDFGTTPVLIDSSGCPSQAVAINKDGEMFLYDRARIDAGPVQRLRVAVDSATAIPLIGMPAWDPSSRTLVLVSPTTPPGSVLRAGVQAFALTSSCRLALRWQAPFDFPDAGGPPTIAGGVLYIGTGRNGRVRAYRMNNGDPLWAPRLSSGAIFAAPTIDRRTVFVAGWSGQVWALRPPR